MFHVHLNSVCKETPPPSGLWTVDSQAKEEIVVEPGVKEEGEVRVEGGGGGCERVY